MPKLIDYPRTSYTGAWELAEITDDTGGKCTVETAARKLNRKVSGSFKAIIGSAVKFGLLTSKRDLLTTTTLFKRIKHAYDKKEEIQFHREAFLTPPLFTQICRKFRSRELPVQMLDVMLIREFGVEEINAQGVSKAFVDGARMVGLLDERNTIADIDAFANNQPLRRELASPLPTVNTFRSEYNNQLEIEPIATAATHHEAPDSSITNEESKPTAAMDDVLSKPTTSIRVTGTSASHDAIASLFGFLPENDAPVLPTNKAAGINKKEEANPSSPPVPMEATQAVKKTAMAPPAPQSSASSTYSIQISGPGVSTALSIIHEDDITIAIALLEKIRRQLTK